MAHQAHGLPWSTLSGLLVRNTLKPSPGRIEPQIDLCPADPEDAVIFKKIEYFGQTLQSQVEAFARSDRHKLEESKIYNERVSKLAERTESTILIPEQLLKKYGSLEEADLSQMQSLETWFDHAHDAHWIDGGEVIKLLMMTASKAEPFTNGEDQFNVGGQKQQLELPDERLAIDSLLLLANHPKTRITNLIHMHWGYHFGVSRVAEEALKAYIYFNILYLKACEDPRILSEYRNYPSYTELLDSVTGSYDGDAQNHYHRGVLLTCSGDGNTEVERVDVLADLDKMKDYLRACWRILVTYHVVLQELGEGVDWKALVWAVMANPYRIYPS